MNANISKGRDGWEAKTTFDLGTKNRVLVISTHKTTGGMVTSATVNTKDGDFLVWDMFGDFSHRVTFRGARCTEKSVRDMHQSCLQKIDQTIANALAHYEAKEAQEVTA